MTDGTFRGADVEALLTMAEALLDSADALELVDLRTADGLAGLAWVGSDAARQREEWDTTHALTLHATAALLRQGAHDLVTQAEDQEVASGGSSSTTTTPTAPSTGPSPTERSALLRERLGRVVHDGLTTSGAVTGALAPVTNAVTVATVLGGLDGLRVRAAQALALGEHVADLSIGPHTSAALGALGVVGTVASAHDAYHGHQEGDLWRTTDGAVSAALGAAATRGNLPAAAAGAAWWFGGRGGELVNGAMAGTRFEENFTERMDAAFDVLGPVGMLVTPGALAVAGAETAGEALGEWAADVWHGTSGGIDGIDGTVQGAGGAGATDDETPAVPDRP